MSQRAEGPRSLIETLPEFACELQRLLIEKDEPELASQVPSLRIFERCSYGDDFCATFYTQPKPKGAYGPGHRNVVLAPDDGTIILDVVEDQICCVEVLDREDVCQKLLAVVPCDSHLSSIEEEHMWKLVATLTLIFSLNTWAQQPLPKAPSSPEPCAEMRQQFLKAFNANDADAVVALYAEGIEGRDYPTGKTCCRGILDD